ncbi:phage/plasmid primase, P4 family, partial [Selenomonas ruminantium]
KLNEFIYEQELGRKVSPVKQAPADSQNGNELTVDEIIEKIRQSEQALLFSSLFDYGDLAPYKGDDSAADLALMNILPFWTGGNFEMMREIFSLSALARREKWERRDYQDRTIQKALADWNGQIYDIEQYKKNKQAAEMEQAATRLNLSENTLRQMATLPATDTGNAERLKLVHGDNIKYLPEKGRGCAWVVWDGKKWGARYESSIYGRVSETMELAQKAVRVYAPEGVAEKLYKFLVNSCNQNKIDSCLKRAREMLEGRITDFDKDGYLLNVQNGIIDLKTGKLLPHDRERMCSKVCRAEYKPELMGLPSLWTKTLETIIPDEAERQYLQKWAGYMLIGSAPEEKLLFLYGEGGCGKGTFANTLGYMMGDYADTVDIEIFLASRNDGHAGGAAASPEIAKLAGVRVAMASESGIGRKMNDAKVKNMTGRDDITARFLYGQPFTFSPAVKFVLQSNYLPAVHDSTDTGIRRRLVIAPFMENFEDNRDVFLKEKLKEPENLAAVLAWCVEGCQLWQNEGLGKEPERYQRAAGTFYEDSDTLQQFLDSECIIGEPGSKARVKVNVFLSKYTEWVGERMKRKTLITMMRRKGFNTHRFDVGQCFDGVKLKPNTYT